MSIDEEANVRTVVVFRNDDPSACSNVEHEQRIASLFDRYGLCQTLGVVPLHCSGDPKDPTHQRLVRLDENPKMVKHLREYAERSGSEIALHGCTHQVNRLARPSRREEFEFEGLPLDEQEELIARGTEVLVDVLGVRPCTFIAPWNRLDRNTILACKRQGYRIVSSGPYAPTTDGIQSLGMNCTLDTFRSLCEMSRATEHTVLLIINYHSPRIRTKRDLELLEDTVELAASSDCEVLTLKETVQRYPELVQRSNAAAINIVPQWQIPLSDRSRAAIYERALRTAGVRNRLTETCTSARSLYWQGRYEEVCRLTPLIDGLCRRLLRSGRFIAAGTSAVAGGLLWAVLASYGVSHRMYWCIGALILVAMSGTAFHWYLTNGDAKREMLTATLLAMLSAACSVAVGELVSLFHFVAPH